MVYELYAHVMTEKRAVAVIVDLVESRKMTDREARQAETEVAFRAVDALVAATEPLHPTVGDEFQAVYATLGDALVATAYARLFAPETVDIRSGIARGEIRRIATSSHASLQDGSAWWGAREAIDEAHKRAERRTPTLRSWFRSIGPGAGEEEAIVNAYLLTRDHLIGAMTPRARRLAQWYITDTTQTDMARREGITQSAVSQSLHRFGIPLLVDGLDAVRKEYTR